MLNKKETEELHFQLTDVINSYLYCKNSKDECIRNQTAVRASNLYAVMNVLENISFVWPAELTQSVLDNAKVDAQAAFDITCKHQIDFAVQYKNKLGEQKIGSPVATMSIDSRSKKVTSWNIETPEVTHG